ncbi:MAG TPA: serine protease [Thioploca sp.]|nr:serine protease [Thioploca sp.]
MAMTDEALKKRIHNEIANATVKILVANEFQGTGFFITPDGYALTAYHCIGAYPPDIIIETRFGDRFNAELSYAKSLKHNDYDIAVLKVNHNAAHCVPLGTISNRHVTDEIVAIGYPAGDKPEHKDIGYFFSNSSQIRSDKKIQIPDAIKGRGQSGGPVYHYATQRVIGLVLAGYKFDVLMDTGLAVRFDALFEKWPELEIMNNQVAQSWDKRLAQDDDSDNPTTSHENPTISNNPVTEKVLSRAFFNHHPQQKRQLINALLDCPSMKDNQLRNTVLQELRPEISENMPSRSQSKHHIVKIVDTCLNFSGGLAELIDTIRFFDENTQQMQALDALIRQL